MLWFRPAMMAGKFYPKGKQDLQSTLEDLLGDVNYPKLKAVGLMAPHAGYIYSGQVAADVFSRVEIPPTVIILCPNHTGRGPGVSIWSEGNWDTPLGKVQVEEKLASDLLRELRLRDGDMLAHMGEHAIEVEVPFLQFLQPKLKIVPIVLGHLTYDDCRRVGEALKTVVERANDSILLVASSDMSHYIPEAEAKAQDDLALREIERLESEALYKTVLKENISMCGFIPTTAVMEAARQLGANSVKRYSYSTSAAITGDTNSVVAYANAVFLK